MRNSTRSRRRYRSNSNFSDKNNNRATIKYFKETTLIQLIIFAIQSYINGDFNEKISNFLIGYFINSGLYLLYYKVLKVGWPNEKTHIKYGRILFYFGLFSHVLLLFSGQRGPGQRGPGQRGPGQRGPGQRGPGPGPSSGYVPNPIRPFKNITDKDLITSLKNLYVKYDIKRNVNFDIQSDCGKIKKMYLALALSLHPDKSTIDSVEDFKYLNNVNDELKTRYECV